MFDNVQLFAQALGIQQPWKLDEVKFEPKEGQLDIYISHVTGSLLPCPSCQQESGIHDTKERTWRHLNFFQHRTYIHCNVPRVMCGDCGHIRQVEVPWARPGSGFTLLFEALVMELATHMPVKPIGELVGEHDTRIWRIIHYYVDEARAKEDYSSVEQVGIDETSSKRGHNYISVFVDLEQSKVLYATEGKDASTVTRFTQDLINHNGSPDNIKDVSCDMSPAYIKGVTNCLPEANITFDKFHVMKLLNEAVDQVRRIEQKENSNLKSTRYIWLKNPSNLHETQRKKLSSLVNMNLKTARAYNMKLSFQEFWDIKSKEIAEQYLKRWYFWATHSKLEPMISFAYTIKDHWEGVINYISTHINNGVLEAINGLIQSAKRKARGYRNINNLITIVYLSCGKLSFDLPFAFG
jgi:transposase